MKQYRFTAGLMIINNTIIALYPSLPEFGFGVTYWIIEVSKLVLDRRILLLTNTNKRFDWLHPLPIRVILPNTFQVWLRST